MLSVLIPTYNYSVLDLVKQIQNQAVQAKLDFEIIVYEDGSSDNNTLNENSKIESISHCIYIKGQENIGRTASRNILAAKAKFNTLLFLDADVLPNYSNFISKFNLKESKDISVVFGGITYQEEEPETNKILRWKYGKEREAKSVKEREKEPYFIISQNLLIHKELFLEINSLPLNTYGLDILFSNNLKRKQSQVIHIDNPVIHLGLENSTTFLKKTLAAVKTTIYLENKGLIDKDLRPLQKSYLLLKKYYLIKLFCFIVQLFSKRIERNLVSENPSLFLLDLYRLHYFITEKNKNND